MTTDLQSDLRAAVTRAFRGAEEFSCLAGSRAHGRHHPGSDIDVVVVLPDSITPKRALDARAAFTHEYIELHLRHGAPPDLRWPGEVLQLRDLHVGLAGNAFTLPAPDDGPLELCELEQPYRYWISMLATGVAITNEHAFRSASAACTSAIANHLAYNAVRGVGAESASGTWRLDPITTRALLEHSSSSDPDRWARTLAHVDHTPLLDHHAETWQTIAETAYTASKIT